MGAAQSAEDEDPEVALERADALERWRQSIAAQGGRVAPFELPDLLAILRWLPPRSVEEKKMWIRRFCKANPAEAAMHCAYV